MENSLDTFNSSEYTKHDTVSSQIRITELMTPEMPRKQQYNPSNDNKDNQDDDSGLGFDSEQNTNLRQTVNDSGSGQITGAAFFRSPEPRMNLVDCTPPSH